MIKITSKTEIKMSTTTATKTKSERKTILLLYKNEFDCNKGMVVGVFARACVRACVCVCVCVCV